MHEFAVICYDIFDDRRRRHVSLVLESNGWRVQESVFECRLSEGETIRLLRRLECLIDREAGDQLLAIQLCPRCERLACSHGQPIEADPGPLLIL